MVQVKVTEGVLEGEIVHSDVGGTFFSFKGIPYAEPPIDNLRFKAPQPHAPWDGVRPAKEFGQQCYQYNFFTRTREGGSEDCLYLNIYSPNIKPAEPLPVMVWIHGGAFCSGNGNDGTYGPEFLVRHDVILVTFNYRLEVLGFLSLETEEIPGNAGAKDQVAALRWIKKNIANFGGDPENITLFGQSAGAVCISYHCLSPMTKGLFKRAICGSGTIISWSPHAIRAKERAIALAKKLGCNSEDDDELCEFFKNQPVDRLIDLVVPLTYNETQKDRFETHFMISSEKVFPNIETFFTGEIQDALINDIHEGIELITGYNEDDGAICLSVIYNMKNVLYQANNLKEYFCPKVVEWNCSTNEQQEVGKAFKDFYAKNTEITLSNLTPMTNFFNAHYFKYAAYEFAKYFARKNKVYFYKFSCKSERNFYSKMLGVTSYFNNTTLACHIDEVPYLFPVQSIAQQISKDTFILINNMTKLWTNFAKIGNPTPDATLKVNWKPFRWNAQYFIDIGNKLTRGIFPDKQEMLLWEQVLSKHLPSAVCPTNIENGTSKK